MFGWIKDVIDTGLTVAKKVIEVVEWGRDIFFGNKKEQQKQQAKEEEMKKEIKETLKETSRQSEVIAQTPSYDHKTASVQQTMQVNDTLSEMKNTAMNKVDKIEKQLTDLNNASIKRLINFLEEHGDIDKNLKQLLNKNLDTTYNTLHSTITSNLSLDNPKCLEILKREKGVAKRQAMDYFIHEILSNGLKDLGANITKEYKSTFESVKNKLNSKIETQELLLQRSIKNLEDLIQSHDIKEKQAKEMQILHSLCQSEFAINFLNQKGI
ncbi:hypothetical protein CQA53_04455 [Helicobacter didelphidarum]|uniref:Uncharacterized protein n=1 Tax=Helicobacter didelphidarum TaxID=2040648 RepID=A0A3D8IMC5_9HELI|nr:hypothetical protein [Helicobacter didelphidarum]RDU66263.1 hypothetical protein CQA53_04455 [Helicobacter didelphidarum]